ncbi:MAG TPA: MauE/DoxX family redox-associated membrane protein [Micromonosporaceae bacterium]|nr:MauE/DoxX family redox-associated membrane protein [Micromonosporaceae bacterium]
MNVDPLLAGYVLVLSRATVGLAFALSAAGKLRDPKAFREAVAGLRLVPSGWSAATAAGVLATEVAIVVLVTFGGPALLLGFVVAVGLLAVFSGALVMTLRRGVIISCNCFGPDERSLSPYDVVRNLLLVGCALAGLWAMRAPRESLAGLEVVLTTMMAVSLVVLVTNVHDVLPTLRRPFRPVNG